MDDTRIARLKAACAIAGETISSLASRLDVSRSTLHAWTKNGDPATEGLTLAHKASRARLGDEGPLTAARIAAVLGCPADALHPGGLVPTWSGDASLLAPVLDALGLSPSGTVQQAVAAIDGLRASALAVLDDASVVSDEGDDGWALVFEALPHADNVLDGDPQAARRAAKALAKWADAVREATRGDR